MIFDRKILVWIIIMKKNHDNLSSNNAFKSVYHILLIYSVNCQPEKWTEHIS